MKTRQLLICLLAVSLLATPGLYASGFSVYEQGAKASGMAGAYVAQADDASANWYNPAALVWMDDGESQFQAGLNLITAGGDTQLTVLDPSFGVFTPTTYEPDSSIVTPVHFYYTQKVSSNVAWGIGLNTPFGLITEWVDRPITFTAATSELQSFVLNPNVAFRMTDSWSLAVGADYIYADVKEFSREVPLDIDMNPFNGFEVIGFSNLTGDGDDIGWNIALSHRTDVSSFGLTYRSKLSPDIDGNIEYTNFGPLAGAFPSSSGTTAIDLPAQAAIGWSFALSNAFNMEVDVAWAQWSSFESIDIDIDNNTPFSQDISILEDWDDTFSYRVGFEFQGGGASAWRFGAVFDESPVPQTTLRPSIPDADRTGLTLGYGYQGSKWDIDAYYMALSFDDIDSIAGEEGVIVGTYESFVHLAGLSLNCRF